MAPEEIPHCAGRAAVAHERTAMSPVYAPAGDRPYVLTGWVCRVCGEVDPLGVER